MSDDSQERTEEATEKRQKESKEKGVIARSKEFNTLFVLLASGFGLVVFGEHVSSQMLLLCESVFSGQTNYFETTEIVNILTKSLSIGLYAIVPFLILMFIAPIFSSVIVGGWSFSAKAFAPKLERLSPIKGLQKIVSIKSLVELFKSILKIILVTLFSIGTLVYVFDRFISLGSIELSMAVAIGLKMLVWIFIFISSTLLLVSAIDIPYQLFSTAKEQKMTKQEVKDEFKDTEGKPEVKARIAQMQRQLAQQRMMQDVPTADVVITNPDHFAVALKYDENGSKAPIMVAKGADHIAQAIKDLAIENKVPIVRMPPLARAIFYNAEISDEIPRDLYGAVAKVLAYIYQLNLHKKGKAPKPSMPKDIAIPSGMKH